MPWPVVFLTTDLMNEFFGKKAVRRLTFLTTIMILYMFAIIFAAIQIQPLPSPPSMMLHFIKYLAIPLDHRRKRHGLPDQPVCGRDGVWIFRKRRTE
jgi:hypothetical protein